MADIFDLAKARKNKPYPDEEQPQEPIQDNTIFDVARRPKEQDEFQIPERKEEAFQESPYDDEDYLQRDIERNQARTFSNVLTTVAGLPGNIESFGRYLVGADKETFFPTSESLQKGAENLSGGYLEPKTEFEKGGDELTKDIAAFSMGGTPSLLRNIGIPVAGLLAKEGIKYAGGDEKNASYGKLGTMLLLDVLNWRRSIGHGGARGYASHLFNESESMIPQGATTSAQNLEPAVRILRNQLSQGGVAQSKTQAITKLDEILAAIQNGRIPVRELTEFRKTINEFISSKGGFEFFVPEPIRARAVHNLNQVKNRVIGALEEYGQVNPQFGTLNRAANEAFAVSSASNVITNFIKKYTDKIQSGALKTALGVASTGLGGAAAKVFPSAAGIVSGAAAATAPLYQGAKVAYQMIQSPTLRRYYLGMFRDILSGNASSALKEMKHLDNELLKDEKKKKLRVEQLKKEVKNPKHQNKNKK